MSKKTLNKANLERLGAPKLAELVMELVQGSAVLQRRARMELSAAQGPKEVVADLRKRFASLLRSQSYVDWRKQRALVKDLNSLLAQIETVIAPHDASEAFELLWSFLQLAPSIHDRAARIVLARADELDGDNYTTLSHAAEALDARQPLAATLLRRAMVEDTLKGAKSTRYRHAARHLAECQASEPAITDYGAVLTHDEFVAALQQKHGRKYGFWSLVDG